ncbi:MAG: DUF1573 domain-containing protein [Alloprevotella sp.]|nr:DUF1573 domain-containing protein [Alloprevotella sp.]
MKKILLLSGMLLVLTLSAQAQAVITFEKKSHNFGTFPESQEQVHEFTFTNTGDKPLVINQAFSSCGCTIPSYTEKPIQPGAKGVIVVRYNAKGTFGGRFRKPVTIRTNAKNSQERLYIEGNVIPEEKK